MAFPTDFDSMIAYVSFLMQDSSLYGNAISPDQKGEQINAVAKFLWSEKTPQIQFVPYDDELFVFGDGDKVAVEATANAVDDVLACYRTSSDTAIIGEPLERAEFHDIMAMYAEDDTASATTTHWAAARYMTGNTPTTANPMALWIYPPANDSVSLAVVIRPSLPVLVSASVVDFTREEVAFICRVAAWACASLAGRSPAWCEQLLQPLPDDQAMLARKYKSILKPSRRLQEEPV